MREEYRTGASFSANKMSKGFKTASGTTLTAEINAFDPAAGSEENAVFLGIKGPFRFGTLSPTQARELADHLNALADAFDEAHKPPTRVETVDAYPVGTIFKTKFATYVRTINGVTYAASKEPTLVGQQRGIDPFFRNTNKNDASDLTVLYTPEEK